MITERSLVVAADDIAVANLEGEAVVLGARSGNYYGLNEVGTRVLELVEQPQSVNDMMEVLAGEYEVERSRLREEVLGFLKEMEDNQLIRVISSEESLA